MLRLKYRLNAFGNVLKKKLMARATASSENKEKDGDRGGSMTHPFTFCDIKFADTSDQT